MKNIFLIALLVAAYRFIKSKNGGTEPEQTTKTYSDSWSGAYPSYLLLTSTAPKTKPVDTPATVTPTETATTPTQTTTTTPDRTPEQAATSGNTNVIAFSSNKLTRKSAFV